MIKKLLIILGFLILPQVVGATNYYVDETIGLANGNGLATTTAFNNLDAFTEAARTAGDIVFVRRVATTTARSSDLNFTSDGTIANPIIISADYDNLWSDFATSTQTYTITIGSDKMTASASITNITAGDWIYVAGDCFENYGGSGLNQCAFAYEVSDIVADVLHFYIPYKGNQSGAGLNLRVMPDNPQWNVATGDFQWNFDTDDYWLVKGLDIRGTDANGNVEIDSSIGHSFMDSIFVGNGTSDYALQPLDDLYSIIFNKVRTTGEMFSIRLGATDVYGDISIKDSLFDELSLANSRGISFSTTLYAAYYYIADSFFRGSASCDICTNGLGLQTFILRNTLLSSSIEIESGTVQKQTISIQDHDGIIGLNKQYNTFNGSNSNTEYLLSTSTLRTGGGPTAIEVRPTTNTTSIWDLNKIKLFEYPIYTDTSSKQYDVYFRNATSTEFTNNPTHSELWIQCEYWTHATNATSTRKVQKSTGTLNLTGSTNWQNLSVTCQPTQTGINYVSGWYAKTKETGQTNIILIDNTPVIQ